MNYHYKTYGENYHYQNFAEQFRAEMFDPNLWANIIELSGAKYVVLTSKHHEGYTLWPSEQSWGWNSVDVGPQMDLVGILSKAIKAKGIHMGLYHSLYEWYNPLYLADNSTVPPNTNVYVQEILLPQLKDIVLSYEPDIIWADGEWEQNDTYWESTDFIAWLYNDSPVKDSVVVNDRWGFGCRNTNGGFWTGGDKWNPGFLVDHKWENCNTIGRSWGYDEWEPFIWYQTSTFLIQQLVITVSCGGNYLLDVGPTASGTIPPLMVERLADIGSWLQISGEGIYESVPWRCQNDSATPDVWYTFNNESRAIYAFIFNWPTDSSLLLSDPIATSTSKVYLMGVNNVDSHHTNTPVSLNLPFVQSSNGGGGLKVTLPSLTPTQFPQFVYTLKLENFN